MNKAIDRRRAAVVASLTAGCLALGMGPAVAGAAGRPAVESTPDSAVFGAKVVWETRLHSRYTLSIESCHLVEGQIYAIASDGSVFAVRADTGQLVWNRRIVDEGQTLRAPVIHRTAEHEAIVFTAVADVRFLEPRSGYEIHRVRVAPPAVASVALSENRVFSAQTGQRLAVYRLSDSVPLWRAEFSTRLSFAPVYVQQGDFVVVMDTGGVVAGVRATDYIEEDENRQLFARQFRGEAEGWLAVDEVAVYVATANQMLHVLSLLRGDSIRPGDILWEYRLHRPPRGGPVVTKTTVYQATAGGGLHRIGKEPLRPNWYDPEATQFLAEWPDGVVVLREGGKLALIRDNPADPVAVMDAGEFTPALSNTLNDAVFLISRRGVIRCLRPVDARPLTLADFRTAAPPAPPTEPGATTAKPAEDQAEEAAEAPAPLEAGEPARPDPFRSPRPTAE